MTRLRRLDTLGTEALASPVQLPNGSWRLQGYATRAGVLRYLNPDGTERLEFRPPEEVEKTAAGLALCVLTHRHPPEGYVTPETAGKYQRGMVLDSKWDATSQRVPVDTVVTDQRLLDALSAGVSELSAGYSATVTEEPGEWNGQRYTHVQRDIQYNHLAVVERGRAGPDCALRLDAEGNVEPPAIPPIPVPSIDTPAVPPSNVGNRATPPSPEGSTEEQRMDVTIEIGGKTFTVPKALADALTAERAAMEEKMKASQTALTTREGEMAAVKSDLQQKVDAAAREAAALKSSLDAATVKLDSANSEVERLKKERNDAASPEKLAALVDERVELVARAGKVLGTNYNFKAAASSPHQVRVDALDKLLESKPDLKAKLNGYTPEQVSALFDVEMARFDAGETKLGPAHAPPPAAPPMKDPFLDAQEALRKKQQQGAA